LRQLLTRIIHEIQAQTEEAWNPISGSIQDKSFLDTDEHGQGFCRRPFQGQNVERAARNAGGRFMPACEFDILPL